MVATHLKKIKQNVPCVTGVYLRDITNMIFAILHLNVSFCCCCCLFFNQKSLGSERENRVGQEVVNQPNFYFGFMKWFVGSIAVQRIHLCL